MTNNELIAHTATTIDRWGNSDNLVHAAMIREVTDRRTGRKIRWGNSMRQFEVVSIACGANLGLQLAHPKRHIIVTCPACLNS